MSRPCEKQCKQTKTSQISLFSEANEKKTKSKKFDLRRIFGDVEDFDGFIYLLREQNKRYANVQMTKIVWLVSYRLFLP